MAEFLIDTNLPYYFKLWLSEKYLHQNDLDPKASDKSIWEYALLNNLTIISKDSDFSNRILVSKPPPKVIHIKFGNIKMNEFHDLIHKSWDEVIQMSMSNKLVNVYKDRIEGIN